MKLPSCLIRPVLLFSIIAAIVSLSSCNSDDPVERDIPGVTRPARQTVLMYMPWSGLYNIFLENISSFESAIENNRGLDDNALLVFISKNSTTSHLIRIYYQDGMCQRDTLKQYDFQDCNYTTAEGITSIISDAMAAAPAEKYAMVIGSHGTGWIPKDVDNTLNSWTASRNIDYDDTNTLKKSFGAGVGGNTSYKTDITTFAEGINNAGIKMEYIMFDGCYMSNIETAYDLRNESNYIIASTCEIMEDGMPYAKMGIDLLNNNYQGMVDNFYDFYSTYKTPCGTIGVIDCKELDSMADIMYTINTTYPDGLEVDKIETIQDLDGYSPTIFFDFGDYVTKLYIDETLLTMYEERIENLVPYKRNTNTYYFYNQRGGFQKSINTFSGVTISDPSVNQSIARVKTQTNWYKATH